MYESSKRRSTKLVRGFIAIATLSLLAGGAFFGYRHFSAEKTPAEKIAHHLEFDSTVSESEKQQISDALKAQGLNPNNPTKASVKTSAGLTDESHQLEAYVPVTNLYSVRQKVTTGELASLPVSIAENTDPTVRAAIADFLGITEFRPPTAEYIEDGITFLPIGMLTDGVKLLAFDGSYFLDDPSAGAIFREVEISGEGASDLTSFTLEPALSETQIFKINQTGVTALTRVMMRKLASVGDPLYFSEQIGEFLADADLTHVSNEVSFKENCAYSYTAFCSPPEFIETLKASGVDLVELTGNHNNDLGAQYNTDTINLYHSLGWATVGGGLNTEEAAKPYVTEQKGSKISVLAYNYPDSPNGGAIAGANKAGANSFDFERIETDITAAKQNSDFVIVDVQFWECYAYPEGGYVEYPVCDKPIGQQEDTFKKLVDLGADMVVGTSAHQPQTYERYKDKMIYYGLGNLYFDQTQWRGTERGIVLTHYFAGGKLLQTKLTPTVYDKNLQTRIMTDDEAGYLLQRLHDAR